MKSLLLNSLTGKRSAAYAKFGTYGFLSMLLATQMAASPSLFADESAATKVDRAGTDDAVNNVKDEAGFQKRKAERND